MRLTPGFSISPIWPKASSLPDMSISC